MANQTRSGAGGGTSGQTPPDAPAPNEQPSANPIDPPTEAKRAVIAADDTKSGRRLRVVGFKGSYKGIEFDDDGVSATPVPPAVADELRAQYPNAQIEDV